MYENTTSNCNLNNAYCGQRSCIFYLSYFVSDSQAQFGERSETSSATIFTKIYWAILACIVIVLLIPFEKIVYRKEEG